MSWLWRRSAPTPPLPTAVVEQAAPEAAEKLEELAPAAPEVEASQPPNPPTCSPAAAPEATVKSEELSPAAPEVKASQPPKPPACSLPSLTLGSRVILSGVASRPELNGEIGSGATRTSCSCGDTCFDVSASNSGWRLC